MSQNEEKSQLHGRHPELDNPKAQIVVAVERDVDWNASGWKDQLNRQYGLLSLCGIALTVDSAWIALGTSISVSIRTYRVIPLWQ
ncbi:hypothetical protein V1523DRAFT_28404 [Lipomyces doorenjongii]